jgi:nucleoside-diphosphate-sugar epimerase
MHVFVTGATGFLGSAIVRELLDAGHEVLGLARSEAAARALVVAGAAVQRGTLEDRDSLRRGAERADGVIHAALPRESTSSQAAANEWATVRALAAALAGSNCPLLVTAATAALPSGELTREDDRLPATGGHLHVTTEQAADAVATWGVRVVVVRLPPIVYDAGQEGHLLTLLRQAQPTEAAAYLARGCPRWAAVHRRDAAWLYRLALEQRLAPGTRLHAVAEEGVSLRELVAALHHQLSLPTAHRSVEAAAGFEQLANFGGADRRATSQLTRRQLAWQPRQLGVLAHLRCDNC